jgi:hypothetical protein
MKTWTTETWLAGAPEQVLELLSEPDAIARWAPIAFEVLDLDRERLVAGTRARVSGALAGATGGVRRRDPRDNNPKGDSRDHHHCPCDGP